MDRFYRIDIPAYTMEEKRAIFAEYVLPNALQAMKIEPHEVTFTDPAINTLIREYAVQPGIRDLEQFAEKMLSHYLFIQETDGVNSIEFTETDLRKLLGPPIALERNFTTSPGMVFSAFLYDGKLSVISVQAQIKKGSGKLQTVNIESKSQREYCQMAYEAVRSRFHFLSENVDVVLAINLPICESQHNYVGIAVCAAILSALSGKAYRQGSMFWGGCDLMGTFYLDENDITPLIKQTNKQFEVIYTAYGATKKMFNEPHFDSSTGIIELPNAQMLADLIGFDESTQEK